MKNKRIKLTSTGHYVAGILSAFVVLVVMYHVIDYFYPASYYKNDEHFFEVWFVLWFASAFISLICTIPLALEWEHPIIFEKFTKRNWFAAMLFTLFHVGFVLVLSIPWKDIRLFEIVEENK